MRKFVLLFLPLFFINVSFAQYNFGFEEFEPGTQTLKAWNRKDSQLVTGGLFRVDGDIKYSGQYSLSIERTKDDTAFRFTPINVKIPANFNGSKITASCWLKTRDVTNAAQMWLRIDDANGKLLDIINYPVQLKGTTDWQRYEKTINLPEDAKVIYFGFLLVGKGKVWADDFSLLVDGRSLDKVAKVEKPLYKAMQDQTAFEKGSGIEVSNPTTFQIESLSVLGKLWGFLKYYHPYVAAGNLNWDYELFRFLPSYLSIASQEQRNTALLQWIHKLGAIDRCASCNDKLLKKSVLKPDLRVDQ